MGAGHWTPINGSPSSPIYVQIRDNGNREVKNTESSDCRWGGGIMEVGRRVVGEKESKVSQCNQDSNANGFRDPGTSPSASGTVESTLIVYP